MPVMSGEETLPFLRELQPGLEVVVTSGYSEAEALRLFRGARVSGFIQKPYTVQQLVRKVKSVLA
jgi:DNA-binding NarL/FixJ family response regulator